MGSMRKSRLSQYKQDRLTEHFVSGSTARTTASLCGVNLKIATFHFFACAKFSPLNWKLKVKLMRATLVAGGKESAGVVLRVKSLYLAYQKGVERFTQRLPWRLQERL